MTFGSAQPVIYRESELQRLPYISLGGFSRLDMR